MMRHSATVHSFQGVYSPQDIREQYNCVQQQQQQLPNYAYNNNNGLKSDANTGISDRGRGSASGNSQRRSRSTAARAQRSSIFSACFSLPNLNASWLPNAVTHSTHSNVARQKHSSSGAQRDGRGPHRASLLRACVQGCGADSADSSTASSFKHQYNSSSSRRSRRAPGSGTMPESSRDDENESSTGCPGAPFVVPFVSDTSSSSAPAPASVAALHQTISSAAMPTITGTAGDMGGPSRAKHVSFGGGAATTQAQPATLVPQSRNQQQLPSPEVAQQQQQQLLLSGQRMCALPACSPVHGGVPTYGGTTRAAVPIDAGMLASPHRPVPHVVGNNRTCMQHATLAAASSTSGPVIMSPQPTHTAVNTPTLPLVSAYRKLAVTMRTQATQTDITAHHLTSPLPAAPTSATPTIAAPAHSCASSPQPVGRCSPSASRRGRGRGRAARIRHHDRAAAAKPTSSGSSAGARAPLIGYQRQQEAPTTYSPSSQAQAGAKATGAPMSMTAGLIRQPTTTMTTGSDSDAGSDEWSVDSESESSGAQLPAGLSAVEKTLGQQQQVKQARHVRQRAERTITKELSAQASISKVQHTTTDHTDTKDVLGIDNDIDIRDSVQQPERTCQQISDGSGAPRAWRRRSTGATDPQVAAARHMPQGTGVSMPTLVHTAAIEPPPAFKDTTNNVHDTHHHHEGEGEDDHDHRLLHTAKEPSLTPDTAALVESSTTQAARDITATSIDEWPVEMSEASSQTTHDAEQQDNDDADQLSPVNSLASLSQLTLADNQMTECIVGTASLTPQVVCDTSTAQSQQQQQQQPHEPTQRQQSYECEHEHEHEHDKSIDRLVCTTAATASGRRSSPDTPTLVSELSKEDDDDNGDNDVDDEELAPPLVQHYKSRVEVVHEFARCLAANVISDSVCALYVSSSSDSGTRTTWKVDNRKQSVDNSKAPTGAQVSIRVSNHDDDDNNADDDHSLTCQVPAQVQSVVDAALAGALASALTDLRRQLDADDRSPTSDATSSSASSSSSASLPLPLSASLGTQQSKELLARQLIDNSDKQLIDFDEQSLKTTTTNHKAAAAATTSSSRSSSSTSLSSSGTNQNAQLSGATSSSSASTTTTTTASGRSYIISANDSNDVHHVAAQPELHTKLEQQQQQLIERQQQAAAVAVTTSSIACAARAALDCTGTDTGTNTGTGTASMSASIHSSIDDKHSVEMSNTRSSVQIDSIESSDPLPIEGVRNSVSSIGETERPTEEGEQDREVKRSDSNDTSSRRDSADSQKLVSERLRREWQRRRSSQNQSTQLVAPSDDDSGDNNSSFSTSSTDEQRDNEETHQQPQRVIARDSTSLEAGANAASTFVDETLSSSVEEHAQIEAENDDDACLTGSTVVGAPNVDFTFSTSLDEQQQQQQQIDTTNLKADELDVDDEDLQVSPSAEESAYRRPRAALESQSILDQLELNSAELISVISTPSEPDDSSPPRTYEIKRSSVSPPTSGSALEPLDDQFDDDDDNEAANGAPVDAETTIEQQQRRAKDEADSETTSGTPMLEPRRPSIELSTVSEVSEELSSCTCRLASSSANATQAQVPAVTVAEGAPRDTSSVRADIDSRAANRVANTHPVSPVSSTSLRGQDADDEDNEQAEVSELTTSEPLEVLVAPPPQFDTVRAHSCPHHHHVDNNALSNSNSNKSGQCLYGTQAGATLTLTTNLTTMTTTGDEAEWTERDVAPPSQFGATSVTVGGSAYDEQVEGQPLSSASTAGSFPSAPSDRQLASQSRLKHDDTIEDALPATSCDFDQVESICDEEVPPPLPPQDYATITDADKSRRTARKSSARSTSRELMIEETAMISDNDDDGGTREGYQQQQHDDDDDDYDDESSVSVSHGNVVVAPVTRASSATTRDNDNDNGVADNVASVSRVATMSSTESHTADIMRHLARHDACLDDGAEPNDDGHDHDHHNDDRFACDNYAAPAPIATASPTAAGCTEEPCTPELERDGWHSNATIRRRRRHDDAQHLNQSTSDAAEHVQHVQQVQQQQVVSASNDAQPEANYNNQTANEQRAAEMTQQQQQQQQRQHSNELETQMSTCSSCSCSSYDGATCTLQHKDCEFGDMMLQRQQQVHSQQSSSHQRQQQTNVEQIEGRVVKESDLDAADDDGMDALEAKESFNAVEFSASSSSIGGPNRHQAKAPVAASVTVVSGTDRSCEQQQAKAASETKGNNSSNADDNGDDDGTVHTANYWLRRWIYVSEHEEAEIWRRAIDMPMAGSQAATTVPTKSSQSQPQPHSAEQVEQAEPDQQQQQQQQSSESSATQATATGASVESQDKQSDDEQSTASEREFMSSYKSRTRKMIHRRATVEMYKRIMSNAFGVEKRVEISRSNGEFGFRIHGSRPVVVSAIEKGTCAETCGLQVGDLICAINGTNILDMPHSQVVRLAHSESSRLVLDLVPTNEFLRQRKYTQPNETRQPIISGFLMRLTLDGAATQDGARSADATAAKANDTNKRQKLSNDDDDDDIAQLHNKYQSTDSTIDNNSNACWRRRYVMLRSDNCLYWYRRETDVEPLGALAMYGLSVSMTQRSIEPNYVIRLTKSTDHQEDQQQRKAQQRAICWGSNNAHDIHAWVEHIRRAANESSRSDVYMERSLAMGRTSPLLVPSPDCLGYLHRYDSSVRRWRLRFFVLKDACLYVYRDTHSRESTGAHYLHGFRVRTKQVGERKHAFELAPPERNTRRLLLMAESELERKRWIAALEYSIDRWIRVD